MRILLDECVDRRLARRIRDHDVVHASRAGLAGLSNGELLERAQHEFDVFLTVDRNLSYQQDLTRYAIAVVVMCARTNRLVDLEPIVPAILDALSVAEVGKATIVQAPSGD